MIHQHKSLQGWQAVSIVLRKVIRKSVSNKNKDITCFVVIRIQNHEFQTAVYSSLALFEIYKLHIVSVSEK